MYHALTSLACYVRIDAYDKLPNRRPIGLGSLGLHLVYRIMMVVLAPRTHSLCQPICAVSTNVYNNLLRPLSNQAQCH